MKRLFLMGAFALFVCTASFSQSIEDKAYVDVSAFARAKVVPDRAEIEITLKESDNKGRYSMDELEKLDIPYEVCPGVSSFCGAAAALGAEYTLPGVSQSVVITRMAGRTPVPERESIQSFAAHQATMVIFLSTGMLKELSEELIRGGYAADTPAAIVYKATWPEEKVLHCTIKDLAETAAKENVTKTALIVVGRVLGSEYDRSKLYDPTFTTEFREASAPAQNEKEQ